MKQAVAILGSTGSIGSSTLQVLDSLADRFAVIALSAHSNHELLTSQINVYRPRFAAATDDTAYNALAESLPDGDTRLLRGSSGLEEICSSDEVDIVVFATSGVSSLSALFCAIEHKKKICIANKELLVMAGALVTAHAKQYNVPLIPVDSEHSAIFQCLNGGGRDHPIKKIYLTGSGGALRMRKKELLEGVSPKEALSHPKWKMGKKITVDSATLMNKGLELIEARWLFDVSPGVPDVVIHPEAVIHSMVEFVDGSVLAQLASCDMRLPIQYALTYPERVPSLVDTLDFSAIRSLTFEEPDTERFPCLRLAKEALYAGGTASCVLNSANEVAVHLFLTEKIGFMDIPAVIEKVLEKHILKDGCSLEEILRLDTWARSQAYEAAARLRRRAVM
ncbi:MAG: 1-deoxy-D-xylulose-5-phosphate reductoisomerase [Candidatus Omnitrophica bacterium]|nr:1-deoxy-D-xylulose-5-phosphate reductoisomerase [Candidatus Omnitrophota bacterium]